MHRSARRSRYFASLTRRGPETSTSIFSGSELDWEHRFEPGTPLYMQISRDDCIVHLSEHHGDATPGAALRIETTALDAYCDALNAKRYNTRGRESNRCLGGRDTSIKDPFGNKLTFTAAITA